MLLGLVFGVRKCKFLVGSHCSSSWMLSLEELCCLDSGVFNFSRVVLGAGLGTGARGMERIFFCLFFLRCFGTVLMLRKLFCSNWIFDAWREMCWMID